MKKILKNQREVVAFLVFLLILGGLVRFALFPLLERITSIKDEMEAGSITQSVKKQRLNELPKMKQQYEEIKDQQKQLEILFSKDQAIVLIEKLEKVAQEANDKITISIQEDSTQAVQPQPNKGKVDPMATILVDSLPSKDYLSLKISLIGEYAGIFKFINSLETLQYYCDITGINFSHLTDSDLATMENGAGNSGILNPFSSQVQVGKKTIAVKNNPKLTASLDVVYYLKK